MRYDRRRARRDAVKLIKQGEEDLIDEFFDRKNNCNCESCKAYEYLSDLMDFLRVVID